MSKSQINPQLMNGNCDVEAAAYAAAYADYLLAGQLADDAYYDWASCEQGGGQRPVDHTADSGDSILE